VKILHCKKSFNKYSSNGSMSDIKELLKQPDIIELIEIAIREDIGSGDHSSLACFGNIENYKSAYCIAKEEGVVAGIELAEYIFKRIDKEIKFKACVEDGVYVEKYTRIFEVEGKSISILTSERLVLNFMQRLSGIATQSKKLSDLVKEFNTTILDTRKTTPGMRLLEKWAVKVGGADNHRIGLYDMIMLKDNHVDFSGGIKNAIKLTHDYIQSNKLELKIEIEVRNLAEVDEVMNCGGVQRIMLDNFKPEDIKKAVKAIDGKFETEASGGITFETLRDFAACGVDFISVGALTHSVKSLDLSLRVD